MDVKEKGRENRCLIVNYHCMKYNGGIEQYLYNLVKYLLDDNSVRVIWLLDKSYDICNSFQDIFHDKRLEIVDTKSSGLHWFKYSTLSLDKHMDNVIVSFNPSNMAMSLSISRRYKKYNIKSYYALPNTTGDVYFIERFFKGWLNDYIKARMAKIIDKWNRADSILYFSYNHIIALENNYSITVEDKKKKCLPKVTKMPNFDLSVIENKLNLSTFNFISVSRFDFPHKGYLLGLVQKFGEVLKAHPKAQLYIIGHGPDEQKLKNEISRLDKESQNKIILLGQVSSKDIHKYMAKTHLNISVAGAVASGAIYGVPSIPARNFCYEGCEVYGLLPGSLTKTTSTEPGEDVLPYMMYFMSLKKDEYIRQCYNSYNSYKERYSNFNPYYFFEHKSQIDKLFNARDIHFIRAVTYLYRIVNKIKKLKQ